MSKITSVEKLFAKLWNAPKDKFTWHEILDEHLAMHREEIEYAYVDGAADQLKAQFKGMKEYYNENFTNETPERID